MTTRTRTSSTFFAVRGLRLTGLLAFLMKADAVWRERQKLARMDSHILNDIGKSRAEVKAETLRAAWDAPSRWVR